MKRKTYLFLIIFSIINIMVLINPIDVFADAEGFKKCIIDLSEYNSSTYTDEQIKNFVNKCATDNKVTASYDEANFNSCTNGNCLYNNIDTIREGTATSLECDAILGDPTKPDSVAWLVKEILGYLKVLGPLLVLVLSSIDFAKAIIMSDDDTMKKSQKKLITRLLAMALLYLIPVLVEAILDIFGVTSCSI